MSSGWALAGMFWATEDAMKLAISVQANHVRRESCQSGINAYQNDTNNICTYPWFNTTLQDYLQEHLMEEMKNSNANHTIQTQEEKINS